MFSDELKQDTMSAHQALEKKLVRRIKKIASIADYVQLLVLMHGFYAPLGLKTKPFVKGRHAENIIDDLEYFNASLVPEIAATDELPRINSYHAALGAAYVTEGSTLGGIIIAGMISKKLNISTDHGFSFFYAHKDKTTENWEHFKSVLNGDFSESEKEEIKKAAVATFSTFDNWITKKELRNNESTINR
jgi:heme oxygenase (biliverdin-IX-beta and delta-forming)